MLRAHHEHEVGRLEQSLAHLPRAVLFKVDADLLESSTRVRRYIITLERRDTRALRPPGEVPLLGKGVEDRSGHRAATDVRRADKENIPYVSLSSLALDQLSVALFRRLALADIIETTTDLTINFNYDPTKGSRMGR